MARLSGCSVFAMDDDACLPTIGMFLLQRLHFPFPCGSCVAFFISFESTCQIRLSPPISLLNHRSLGCIYNHVSNFWFYLSSSWQHAPVLTCHHQATTDQRTRAIVTSRSSASLLTPHPKCHPQSPGPDSVSLSHPPTSGDSHSHAC